MNTSSKKEIAEAVMIAAFTTLAAGIVSIGVDMLKEHLFSSKKKNCERCKDGDK